MDPVKPLPTAKPTIADKEGTMALRDFLQESNTMLQDWSARMRVQEVEGKSRILAVDEMNQLMKKRSFVPESWGRYPSHTRAERNALANTEDKVSSEDFAIRKISAQKVVTWSTDKPSSANGSAKKAEARSVSGKIGRAVRTGIGKLIPTRTVVDGDVAKTTLDFPPRLHSADPAMEYPELALLPGEQGYKELCAIERELKRLKPPSIESAEAAGASRVSSDRRSSSIFGGDASSDYENHDIDHSVLPRGRSATGSPVTPIHQDGAHTKSSTNTTERFHTPLSRLSSDESSHDPGSDKSRSGEETAPSQTWRIIHRGGAMRGDGDSIKSDITVVRKAKSTTEPDLRTLSRRNATTGTYSTWAGRARTLTSVVQGMATGDDDAEDDLGRRKYRATGQKLTAPPNTVANSPCG
jgi:hypothetical protein